MMQAYTEEQRKALIEFTKQRIEALRFSIKQHAFESIRKPLQSELAVAEIAMAALTAKPVTLPDDGLDDCIRDWPDQWRNDFDTGYSYASWRYEQEMEKAGVKFTRDHF